LIERIIVLTLVKGSTYAILASGLALIYGVGRIINLAHTAFMMLAAYGIWYFTYSTGWGMAESIAVTGWACWSTGSLLTASASTTPLFC